MPLAIASDEITVVAEMPVIDAGQTAVSSVVRQEQIENLPIDGRNFLSFTVITPGVTTDRTPQQGATGTSGLSFTGQRGRSNNVMVDGLDNNDATVGAVRATFSQEAIREFQVPCNTRLTAHETVFVLDHSQARAYGRLARTAGLDRQRLWFDLLYIQRYNRALRPYFLWAGFGTAYAETARQADHPAIIEMVDRHEGAASASAARYWLGRQPEAFSVMRTVSGDLIGFVANLQLDAVSTEDLAADPAIAPALAYAERHGPVGPAEHIRFGRFWMDRERHQAPSQTLTLAG
jgi:hypothetical protein